MMVQPVLMGEGQSLFGVRQLPDQISGDIGVLILNAGVLHSAGPFRMHVELSNRLARLGYPVLRIDQSGKGESPRRRGMDRASTVLRDYDDAVQEFAASGVNRIVLVGLCWGADDAIYVASQRDNIAGIVALDGFAYRNRSFQLRHYTERAMSPAAWGRLVKRAVSRATKSDEVSAQLSSVNDLAMRDWAAQEEMVNRYETTLNKGVRLLGVYTQGQNYYNYVGQLAANLPNFDKTHLKEVFYRDADHTFSLTAHRERLMDLIEEWIQSDIETGE
jgi:pimeloyl-ACP methyl ester carboxylesterase